MIRAGLVSCAIAGALLAPAAHAASVSVFVPPCALEQSKYGQCYPDEARFAAAPGEANRVTITHAVDPPDYRPRVTIEDSGAPLKAEAGCTQVSDNVVTCAGYNITAHVDTGDGDDEISGPGVLRGGAGNDRLTGSYVLYGGDGDDTLTGGDSPELFQGGAGSDTISGGGGNDTVIDDGAVGEADSFDGGDGADTASYQDRRTGVSVSLGTPAAGEDRLAGVENLRGGSGDDTLTGDAGANTLEGGAGDDTIAGDAGEDILAGQNGADRLDGGAGNDSVADGEDRARNRLACGDGRDRADAGTNTTVAADCEDIASGILELAGKLRLRLPLASPGAAIATLYDLACIELPCGFRMTVTTTRGRVLGSIRRMQRTRRARLPASSGLRLSRTGQALLRRRGSLPVRVTIDIRDSFERSRASFLVTLTRS